MKINQTSYLVKNSNIIGQKESFLPPAEGLSKDHLLLKSQGPFISVGVSSVPWVTHVWEFSLLASWLCFKWGFWWLIFIVFNLWNFVLKNV